LAQEAPEARAARWLATPRLLAFAGGAVVPQGLADLPSPAWLGVGLLLALLARRWSWLPFAFALGLGWSVWHATGLLNTALPAKLEGRDVTVAGVIATLPQRRGRFELVVDHGQPEAVAGVPRRLRLAWYGTHPPLAAGVRWRLRLRLKRLRTDSTTRVVSTSRAGCSGAASGPPDMSAITRTTTGWAMPRDPVTPCSACASGSTTRWPRHSTARPTAAC
jgi:hypothetical protein